MNYMKSFKDQCFKQFKKKYTVQDCASRVMNSLAIDAKKITNQI